FAERTTPARTIGGAAGAAGRPLVSSSNLPPAALIAQRCATTQQAWAKPLCLKELTPLRLGCAMANGATQAQHLGCRNSGGGDRRLGPEAGRESTAVSRPSATCPVGFPSETPRTPGSLSYLPQLGGRRERSAGDNRFMSPSAAAQGDRRGRRRCPWP